MLVDILVVLVVEAIEFEVEILFEVVGVMVEVAVLVHHALLLQLYK